MPEIVGDEGRPKLTWHYQPRVGMRIKLRCATDRRSGAAGRWPAYLLKFPAFGDAIARGASLASSLTELTAITKLIDAIYVEAGMQPQDFWRLESQALHGLRCPP